MDMSKIGRDVLAAEVTEKYEEFQERKRAIRTEVRARIRELEDEATEEIRVEFAKYLHGKHDEGMSWAALSVACKKGTNGVEFNKLRKAWTPPEETDLRTRLNMPVLPWSWTDDTTLSVNIGDLSFPVWDVALQRSPLGGVDSEEYDEWVEFEMPEEHKSEHYTTVAGIVEDALRDRAENKDD